MMGNESTEESKKEIRKRPGAPSPPAKATIFCFQPFKFKGNRHPSLECGSPAAAFFHRLARRKFLTKLKRAKAQPGATLLRKRRAIEMVHEDLHERRPVKIRQPGNLANHANMSKALDGLAILAVLVAN